MAEDAHSYGTIANDAQQRTVILASRSRPQPRRARRNVCCWILIIVPIIILFFIFFYLPFVWVPNTFSCCSDYNPLCAPWTWNAGQGFEKQHNLTNEQYAVGFSLSAGYGTAAISFRNGTTITIGRFDGDDIYRKYMWTSSSRNSTHPTPPYYCRGVNGDSPRQWRRFWRKKFGKPASIEVAALAKVLIGLTSHINEALGSLGPYKYGTIAVPDLPGIYNEDLLDAAQYAGFQLIVAYPPNGDMAQWPVSDVDFAQCGEGLGDCVRTINSSHIKTDLASESSDNILSVSLTMDMLTAEMGGSYWLSGIVNPSLGRGAADSYPSLEDYWTAVSDAITKGMQSRAARGNHLRGVVVYGESAEGPDFQRILRQTVTRYQDSKRMPRVYMSQPLYSAAIGAAKLGKKCMQSTKTWQTCIPDLRPKMQGW